MKVKDFLTEQTWGQKDEILLGRECILTAIAKCYATIGERAEVSKKIAAQLKVEGGSEIADWNDIKERKFQEVEALLEKINV